MRESPILFGTPMVRAILEGQKTQTRRVIKYDWQPGDGLKRCPYNVGQQLWVRETLKRYPDGAPVRYLADGCPVMKDGENYDDWTYRYSVLPAIFMPRWASRITLEITEVKVQRIQKIAEEDAQDEGVERLNITSIESFSKLWDSINSKRCYSWAFNPWVWAITFKVARIK